jgi:nucleoside-diphosphate-sugar epimerase
MKKILVTGAFGQIGSELVPALQKKYGKETVIALGHKTIPPDFDGIVEKGDTQDKQNLEKIIKKYNIGTIYHLVSLLSAKGEIDPSVTWHINMDGLKDILDLSIAYNCKVFWPSSIAAFGPTTPQQNTPQKTILEPSTMYGVTKVNGENLARYYFIKYGLDIRSVRYPGLISWKTEPGGGTTDYAVAIFYDGLKNGSYSCFVREDTKLPMMYMDDAIRGTMQLMDADLDLAGRKERKEWDSYNFSGISFTAQELEKELQKIIPHLKVSYHPDHRQAIADSWPDSFDDTLARKEWGWKPEYNLSKMTKVMVENLKKKFQIQEDIHS